MSRTKVSGVAHARLWNNVQNTNQAFSCGCESTCGCAHMCVWSEKNISLCLCSFILYWMCVLARVCPAKHRCMCLCQGEKKEEKKGGRDMRGKLITTFLTKQWHLSSCAPHLDTFTTATTLHRSAHSHCGQLSLLISLFCFFSRRRDFKRDLILIRDYLFKGIKHNIEHSFFSESLM